MHNNVHYTLITTHFTVFHMQDNLPVYTRNKNKGMVIGKIEQHIGF